MAADLIAPQNVQAINWLWTAVQEGEVDIRIPFEIYGPVAPDQTLPEGFIYMGWAPRLRDIYEGQTAVFAPTVWGAGIQGKYLEAVVAGRPVVVGQHAASSIPGYVGTLPFGSRSELAKQLSALQEFTMAIKPGKVELASESEVRRSVALVKTLAESRRARRASANR
ncbi:glycosyltransferase [Mycolicibacterium elephantis]